MSQPHSVSLDGDARTDDDDDDDDDVDDDDVDDGVGVGDLDDATRDAKDDDGRSPRGGLASDAHRARDVHGAYDRGRASPPLVVVCRRRVAS